MKTKTMVRKDQKAQDPEELNYNSERLRMVITTILQDEYLNSFREKLARMSPEELNKSKRIKESKVRHFLMSQLWATGAGHRLSTTTNMTVGELLGATTTSDSDVMVVSVRNHKTFKTHGHAKIPFVLPMFYEACLI